MKLSKLELAAAAAVIAMAAVAAGQARAQQKQDDSHMTEPEKEYQAGGSPLATQEMHQDINPAAPKMTQEEFDKGRQIYFERCAGCHGVLRKGATGKPLTPDITIPRGTDYLKVFIQYGSPAGMPNWGTSGELTDAEVDLEGVRQRAAREMTETARGARRFFDAAPAAVKTQLERSGRTVVNGFTGSSIWHLLYSFRPVTPGQIEKGYALLKERWTPILDVFQENGVKFALEVQPTEIAFDVVSAKRTLDALDNHPAFGFNYDPTHLGYQGVDYVKFIRTFAKRIYHVHMKDAWWGHGDGTVGVFGGHTASATRAATGTSGASGALRSARGAVEWQREERCSEGGENHSLSRPRGKRRDPGGGCAATARR